MEKKNVPKIRFPGFTEPWEQRKFSELYEKNTEKNVNLIGYDKTISIATMTYKDEGNGASEESLKTYKVLRMGDLAFEGHTNKEFRYGRFVANDIGIGIMSPRFSALRPINEMPISFWKYYIHYEPIMRKILVNSTKAGTMMNELVISDFMEQRIQVPSYEEQNKIGRLFDKLDNLISLHQRKLENLKKQKKGLLQKMFPEKGKKVPEIRFPEFTDDWEQRKFLDITFLAGEKNKDNLSYESYSVSNEKGFIPQNEQFENGGTMKEADKTMYYIVKPNSFVYNPARINVGSIAYSDLKKNVIVSSLYEVFQTVDDVYDRFLWHWFKTNTFQRMIEQFQEGGVRLYFYYDKLCMGSIMMPTFEEQRKIGQCLDKIDNLISLHQRKLEHLQKQKKALLQQMFV